MSQGPPVVEVLWRPGCGFCTGLRRAGIATVEHDIWADPAAAGRVRAATGGPQTVPTVLVGERALVNPSVRQVIAAVRETHPQHAGTLPARAGAALRSGLGWTIGFALLWLALATWQPGTTWHLAPVLVAGSLPWTAGQDLRAGQRRELGGCSRPGWVDSPPRRP